MIGPTGAVRVMVATKPVDFRKGAEGLASLVRETMTADPFSGAVYVFRAKRADRIKLVFWDGAGLCLFAKRLEDGIFRWPKIEDGVIRLGGVSYSRPRYSRSGRRSDLSPLWAGRTDRGDSNLLISLNVQIDRSIHAGDSLWRKIQRIPTLCGCRRDANRTHERPWAITRLWLLGLAEF
jgi:transposase